MADRPPPSAPTAALAPRPTNFPPHLAAAREAVVTALARRQPADVGLTALLLGAGLTQADLDAEAGQVRKQLLAEAENDRLTRLQATYRELYGAKPLRQVDPHEGEPVPVPQILRERPVVEVHDRGWGRVYCGPVEAFLVPRGQRARDLGL